MMMMMCACLPWKWQLVTLRSQGLRSRQQQQRASPLRLWRCKGRRPLKQQLQLQQQLSLPYPWDQRASLPGRHTLRRTAAVLCKGTHAVASSRNGLGLLPLIPPGSTAPICRSSSHHAGSRTRCSSSTHSSNSNTATDHAVAAAAACSAGQAQAAAAGPAQHQLAAGVEALYLFHLSLG